MFDGLTITPSAAPENPSSEATGQEESAACVKTETRREPETRAEFGARAKASAATHWGHRAARSQSGPGSDEEPGGCSLLLGSGDGIRAPDPSRRSNQESLYVRRAQRGGGRNRASQTGRHREESAFPVEGRNGLNGSAECSGGKSL